jgi:hypothetical protein
MSGHDDRREIEALEAKLRADRLEDPGDDFFADLEQRVMREVAGRPAPRRSWWHPAALWRWVWQPAPVAALVGAAAVALVVWVGGPGGPEEVMLSAWAPGLDGGRSGLTARPAPEGPAPEGPATLGPGDAWFARLPPTEELWALDDRDLPALLALVSAEDPDPDPDDDDDDLLPPLGITVGEQSLKRLSEEQLRALERELDVEKRQPRRKRPAARPRPQPRPRPRPRPRPTMRQAG